nr:hypothetical protein MtrunA17_Chr7g0233391 [Ipomoea batatas]
MMVPKYTLERGESSHRGNDDSSSDEEGRINRESLSRGLMLDVEDLFRFRHFRNKEIVSWKYIDTPLLDTLGIRQEVERLSNQPFWRNICGWRDGTYEPVVREFIATLEVNEEVHNHWEPSVKFKLFHKSYEILVVELGNLLGFYTLEDQNQEWYGNLVEDFENEHQPGLFWWCIARSGITWSPSYTSARYIRRPKVLVMWDIIARSWMGRRTHNDNVTREELFILWSMSTETPIHMGELCRKLLRRQRHEDSENIFIGPIVSRLCDALGYGDLLARESVAATMVPMRREDFLRLNLAPYDTQEEEHRGRERRLLEAFQELGNRMGRLEEEVRRLRLTQQEEEPDDPRI